MWLLYETLYYLFLSISLSFHLFSSLSCPLCFSHSLLPSLFLILLNMSFSDTTLDNTVKLTLHIEDLPLHELLMFEIVYSAVIC